MSATRKINMLEGSLWDKLIVFALPLAFTGLLQQLYNAADVAVLGRFVSDLAVAAVGNNVPVFGLIISFCMGLSIGVNVVVARALGMKNDQKASEAVRTSFITAIVFGIFALLIGQAFANSAMDWLDVPEEVRDYALIYLRVYLLGMPFIAITFWLLSFAVRVILRHHFGHYSLQAFLISAETYSLFLSSIGASRGWPWQRH